MFVVEDKFLSYLGVIIEVINDVGICCVRFIFLILIIGREVSVLNLLRFCFICFYVIVFVIVWSVFILLL